MCGNIKKLRFPDRPATDSEIDAAVLQYVRKISDLRHPSGENEKVFDEACEKIGASVKELLTGLKVRHHAAMETAVFKVHSR